MVVIIVAAMVQMRAQALIVDVFIASMMASFE